MITLKAVHYKTCIEIGLLTSRGTQCRNFMLNTHVQYLHNSQVCMFIYFIGLYLGQHPQGCLKHPQLRQTKQLTFHSFFLHVISNEFEPLRKQISQTAAIHQLPWALTLCLVTKAQKKWRAYVTWILTILSSVASAGSGSLSKESSVIFHRQHP